MPGRIKIEAVRLFMAGWIRFSDQSWRDFPRPDDEPRVVVAGPDPIRILTLGGGANVGYGVRSHQLSLGGHLSRQLAGLTGRGVELEIVSSPEMRVRSASRYLRQLDLSVDALVTTFGSLEAYRLLPSAAWRNSVESFLDLAHSRSPALHIFFGAIVPTGSLVTAPKFARDLIVERVRLLNGISKLVCASAPYATFVAFPGSGIVSNQDSRTEQYRQGAVPLAAAISKRLRTS
jgi:hypothetical protein